MVVTGFKKLETRSFPPPKGYTGRLYIHASMRIPGWVYEQYLRDLSFRLTIHSFINEQLFAKEFITDWRVLTAKELESFFTLGAIVGHVDLGQALEAGDMVEEYKKKGLYFTEWQREWIVGDLSSDRWAWPLSNLFRFDKPIPAKGTISPMLWDPSKYLTEEAVSHG